MICYDLLKSEGEVRLVMICGAAIITDVVGRTL